MMEGRRRREGVLITPFCSCHALLNSGRRIRPIKESKAEHRNVDFIVFVNSHTVCCFCYSVFFCCFPPPFPSIHECNFGAGVIYWEPPSPPRCIRNAKCFPRYWIRSPMMTTATAMMMMMMMTKMVRRRRRWHSSQK